MLTPREKLIIEIFMAARRHLPVGHPNQRLGQAIYNTTYDLNYEATQHTKTAGNNPFYNDSNLYNFFDNYLEFEYPTSKNTAS